MASKQEGTTITGAPRTWRNVALSFGLVNVAVSLASLTKSAGPEGHILCSEHKQRIKQLNYCEACEGAPQSTVKGYDTPEGTVTLDEGEIASIEGAADGMVKLTHCVYAGEVDPIFFEKSYNIWPQRNHGIAFRMLESALRDSGKALVGETTLTKTTRTLMVRWSSATGTLVVHLLHAGAAIKREDIEKVRRVVDAQEAPSPETQEMAEALLDTLPGDFDPAGVQDSYSERLMAAIFAKTSGTTPEAKDEPARDQQVEFMDALKATIAAKSAKPKAARKPKVRA